MRGNRIEFSPGDKIPGTRWTVICEAEKKNGERMYTCKCECGTVKDVSAKSLRYKTSKCCGCEGKEKLKELHARNIKEKNKVDLTGKVYGKAEVIKRISGIGCMTRWQCKCLECGKIFEVSQHNLENGSTKSCGCMIRKKASERIKDSFGIAEGTCVSKIESKNTWKTNTTGVRGVSFKKQTGKYIAYIGFKGKLYYLGSFLKLEDAKHAREQAEKEVFGDFLKWYYENKEKKNAP